MRLSDWFFDVSNTARNSFWNGKIGCRAGVASGVYLLASTGPLLAFAFSDVKDGAKLTSCMQQHSWHGDTDALT